VDGATADVADQQTLEPVVDGAVKNLEANGLKPDTVIGDSGFYSGNNIKTMEEKGLKPFIPEQNNKSAGGEGKYGVDDFKYNRERDEYTCPAGESLQPDGIRKVKETKFFKYRAGNGVCQSCKLRPKCTNAQGGRVLYVSEYKPWLDKYRKRMTRRNRRWARRLQRGSVEPVFGEAINFCGNRRVNTRGIRGARKKFIMCAAVQNLKKLIKHGLPHDMAAACGANITEMADNMAGFFHFIFEIVHPPKIIGPLPAY